MDRSAHTEEQGCCNGHNIILSICVSNVEVKEEKKKCCCVKKKIINNTTTTILEYYWNTQ